jgi:astacin
MAHAPLAEGNPRRARVRRVLRGAVRGILATSLALFLAAEADGAAPGPSIELTAPTRYASLLTHSPTLALAGSVGGDAVALRLSAAPGREAQAVALGAADAHGRRAWHVDALALQPGLNVLRLTALDAAGHASVRTLGVTRAGGAVAAAPRLERVDWHGRPVLAEIRGGHAFAEGDVDLGELRALRAAGAAQAGAGRAGGRGDAGIGISDPASFWPKVGGVAQVPYVVTQGNDNVAPAIQQYNAQLAGVIQFVPRGTETDYVDFDLDPNDLSGSGYSNVGRTGGQQTIGGSILCNVPTLLHEMGHATGLWHEQSRRDRDAYVALHYENVIKSTQANFDVQPFDVQDFGLFDVQSLMEYGPTTFTKNGEPTVESIPAGIRVSDLGVYTAGDLDAIKRLYGFAPAKVTVTSNPPGLQVIVDGVTVTTPRAFSFAIGSQHTLGVPAAAQAQEGDAYVFGRWNDLGAAAHTITVAPGNGLQASPVAKPAVTVYQADFVQMVPFAPSVYPDGSGAVSATPAPQSLPGMDGLWFPARTAVTLTAVPNAGYALYRMYTADTPASLNPQTTRHPEWVQAYFTAHPNVTVGTAPAGHWVWVDGDFWFGPVNWTSDYPGDGDWSAGTSHLLDVQVNPQQPYSWSIRYPWLSWSDQGAQQHQVTSPGAPVTYTASFGTQFNYYAYAAPPCAGSVTANPASPDDFYDAGDVVSFDETVVPDWIFSGWGGDLGGTTHPQSLTMDDERLVVPGYNTVATPLAVTTFAPGFATAGAKSLALTITGAGFTSATRLFINGAYVAPSKATATRLTTKLTKAQLKSVGGIEISVDNAPAGNWSCSEYVLQTFPVLAQGNLPQVAPAPAKLTFAKQKVGTTSAPQTVTLTNTGTALAALGGPATTGADAGDFALASACGSALGAAGQCTLSVTFTPAAKGARSASLLLIDSAFDSPQVVMLAGTGN